MEEYTGIDYGNGISNIDLDTNIRFGVIPVNEVLQVWCDDSEAIYPDLECPECKHTVEISDDECLHCEYNLTNNFDFVEPSLFVYNDDGYIAEQIDDTDIFIIKSKYYTFCKFCSPCAPGAGYLLNPIPEGIKTYCFGHNWFENGKAPYPVYDIKTNKQVFK